MATVALVSWLITVGFGSWMLAVWVRSGGLQREAGGAGTNFVAARVFAHFGLAVAGLLLWIVYLAVGGQVLAWISFVAVLLIVLLGSLLVARWAKDRRGATPAGDLAEQHIPAAAVALHGAFATLTLILVLVAAVRG